MGVEGPLDVHMGVEGPLDVHMGVEGPLDAPPAGSSIVVVATDAPLDGAQCTRLARRCGLGLARTGSFASHGSGEIFCAFSTTLRRDRNDIQTHATQTRRDDRALDELFAAVVDASEEAVLDSLFRADTVVGVDGHTSPALPVERVGRDVSA
jgi:D-aminopeptidase